LRGGRRRRQLGHRQQRGVLRRRIQRHVLDGRSVVGSGQSDAHLGAVESVATLARAVASHSRVRRRVLWYGTGDVVLRGRCDTGQLEVTSYDASSCAGGGDSYLGCITMVHELGASSFAVSAECAFCPLLASGGCRWVVVDDDIRFDASGAVTTWSRRIKRFQAVASEHYSPASESARC
jgi:hypothetical protein